MLIDVVSYPDISAKENPFGLDGKWYSKKMMDGYRIAGVKISLDG